MEAVLIHLKDDWTKRLPYRVSNNRYRGLSRSSYSILCVLYYTLKGAIVLYFMLIFGIYKFIFYDIVRMIYRRFRPATIIEEVVEEDDSVDNVEEGTQTNVQKEVCDEEEIPFCQLFNLTKDSCLLVDHVEMCPDETAFIRVVDEEAYTSLYKRKVHRSRVGDRYIKFNGTNYYLDDKKTQPIIKQAKK